MKRAILLTIITLFLSTYASAEQLFEELNIVTFKSFKSLKVVDGKSAVQEFKRLFLSTDSKKETVNTDSYKYEILTSDTKKCFRITGKRLLDRINNMINPESKYTCYMPSNEATVSFDNKDSSSVHLYSDTNVKKQNTKSSELSSVRGKAGTR